MSKVERSGVCGNEEDCCPGTCSRIKQVLFAFGCVFLFFLGLLANYQIIDSISGIRYIRPASLQRRESVPVALARGRILDINGVPLHYPSWHSVLAVFPSKIEDKQRFVDEVAALTGMDEDSLRAILDAHSAPFKLLRGLPPEQIAAIMHKSIPGLVVIPEEIRYGPGSLARHVVGHIRPNAYVNPKDNVGESGLESWFQTSLAGGTSAWVGTLVTGDGSEIPGTGVRMGFTGEYPQDLLTTLDVNIQYKVERVLDQEGMGRGGVVVLDAMSGEILAMASRPQYDQNNPEEYFLLPDAPFVNRNISDFTPGSIWKTVVLALALEKGYVTPDEVFECDGRIEIGSTVIRCGSSPEGHGSITVKQALAQSCNCTLIQVGLRIPPQELIDWAVECGFGNKLHLPLSQQSAGILPEPNSMFSGDVGNFSIGQGYLTVTPVQAACFYRAVACGGKWKNPGLVAGADFPEKTLFSGKVSQFLQEALLLSTLEGTGKAAWVPGFGSAGKTGTAEMNDGPASNQAWFVGWTPILSPKYVICVFCERSGDGPSIAAPLFRKIAEQLLGCR
ncbi:MAG TPA: penicillin-binding protein 2 [Firmicutes bacterium]|nr:penicillin-binding protein 2 [Bacillota bacterium]